MTLSTRQKYLERFKDAYQGLNTAQKKAVDKVDGPVMVIAGPGTGKTQILAVRIGKILLDTDTDPYNILCLTFTDAATISMRNRLVSIIGPDAHKIHIYTFHAFCNQVIQENLDIFGNYRQLDAISDLEKVDVFDKLLSQLPPDSILRRPKGDPRFEAKRMDNLFKLMKKENLQEKQLHHRLKDFLQRKKDSDDFIAGRKSTAKGNTYFKGDFRDDKWNVFKNKYVELESAIYQFSNFQKIMDEEGRYDFEDMILWVVNAFKTNPDLLAKYQERYHYFLVDEYQDTNGAQNNLLSLLIDFWEESPNAFVVGDDDQAIYKFQGANLSNIKEFKNKYNSYNVVLEENYRSSQNILDASSALINKNQERLVNEDESLSKNLIASSKLKNNPTLPVIRSFRNIVHEQAYIVKILSEMYDRNEDLSQTAVIYRKHSQVDQIVSVLEKKGIPLNIKKKIDVLKDPLIDNLLNILFYIQSEYVKPDSNEDRLFELMHYNFFEIDPRDIARISIHISNISYEKRPSWREFISKRNELLKLEIKSINQISLLNDLLSKWTSDIANQTLQSLFENILNEGYVLKNIMQSANKTWKLQVVSTLFDRIKEETSKEPDLNLGEFLAMINKMKEAGLPLELNKVVHSEEGVNFITAHSSKGLEFERVFIIGCTKDVWDKSGSNMYQYSYPDNVNEDTENNTEDERRLFFVAMTRCKLNLNISFSLSKENGKALATSLFIDEILDATDLSLSSEAIASNSIEDFQYYTLFKLNKKIQLIDHDQINKVLQKYKLSVTGLNKYMTCAMSFYFQNILRVPSSRSKYMGFGRAIHHALEKYFTKINKKESIGYDVLIQDYNKGMNIHRSHFTESEYTDLIAYGQTVLKTYYEKKLKSLPAVKAYALEVPINNAEYKGIPIKGVLDKVIIYDDYVEVVDYKTGNFSKPKTKKSLNAPKANQEEGGDYWRQIIFYKLLLESDRKNNWNMVSGTMDFVEPDRKTQESFEKKYIVSENDMELVGNQILDTWEKIQNHEFNILCEDEKCYWCDFVRNDFVFNDEFKDKLEDENEDL